MENEPKRLGRPVATGTTTSRNVRIPDDIWKPAMAIAKARGDTLTDVIEQALKRYIARHRD